MEIAPEPTEGLRPVYGPDVNSEVWSGLREKIRAGKSPNTETWSETRVINHHVYL